MVVFVNIGNLNSSLLAWRSIPPPCRAGTGCRGHYRRAEQSNRRGRVVRAGQRQSEHPCAGEVAEGVWLIRPVKAARSVGVTLRMVLGPVGVGDDVSDCIWHRRIVGWGRFQVAWLQ